MTHGSLYIYTFSSTHICLLDFQRRVDSVVRSVEIFLPTAKRILEVTIEKCIYIIYRRYECEVGLAI
jgi:hypothetical protein